MKTHLPLSQRFRGFLPVVIDVETGGFNAKTDALLELAAVIIGTNDHAELTSKETHAYHIAPFEGANLDEKALEFNGIDPDHPFRMAITEKKALHHLCGHLQTALKATGCQRAVLVGHNAHFDLGFLLAALLRSGIKKHPFHSFTVFDTATLAGVTLGQTVLAKALSTANIAFDQQEAHSALYDAEKTAELFCYIANKISG